MKLASAYYRVSTQEQSFQRQIVKVHDYANQHGIKIVAEFKDKASGTIPDRESFVKLQQWVKDNPGSMVLAAELDRLDRGEEGWAAITSLCSKYNVELNPLNVPLTGEPSMDTLMKDVLHSFAKFERAVITSRMFGGRIAKLRRGIQIVGRWVPYGYDYLKNKDKKKVVVNPHQAKVVKKIFDLYTNQDYSLYQIARYLTNQKIKTKTGKDGWHPNTIKGMLVNESYVGRMYFNKKKHKSRYQHKTKYRPKKDWILIKVEPIIDEELFNKTQFLLKRSKHQTHQRKYEYLLTGVIYCGKCGKKYNAYKAGNGSKYYRCSSRRRLARQDYCRNSTANANKLDPLIWGEVRNLIVNPDKSKTMFLAMKVVRSQNLSHYQEIEASLVERINSLDQQMERAFYAFNNDLVDPDLYQKKYAEMKANKAELEEKIVTNRQEQAEATKLNREFDYPTFLKEANEVAGEIDKLGFAARQKLIRKYIRRVIVKSLGKVSVEFMFNSRPKQLSYKRGQKTTNHHQSCPG